MPEQTPADRVTGFLDAMQDDGLGGDGTLLLGWFGPDSEHLERHELNATDLRALLEERDRLLAALEWIENRADIPAGAALTPSKGLLCSIRGIRTTAREALVKSRQPR